MLKNLIKTAKQNLDPFKHPHIFKHMMNIYPPYVGAGIKVDEVNFDTGVIRITMGLNKLNQNIVGTQFGGSLYSMTDPFIMLLLMQKLGNDYVVWDKSASIDFIKAGKTAVTADIAISDEEVAMIKDLAKDGEPVFRDYSINIKDKQGVIVAKVEKKLYIRLREFSSSKNQSVRF